MCCRVSMSPARPTPRDGAGQRASDPSRQTAKQKPLTCGNTAQQLEEAFPLFTATSQDPRSGLKAFARFSRSYLVLHRGTHGISINFGNVQRAAGSEKMP